jgi:hypothetical protein
MATILDNFTRDPNDFNAPDYQWEIWGPGNLTGKAKTHETWIDDAGYIRTDYVWCTVGVYPTALHCSLCYPKYIPE